MKIAIKREQNPNLFEILSSVSNLREEKLVFRTTAAGSKWPFPKQSVQLRFIMRIQFFVSLLLLMFIQTGASTLAQNVSLNVNNMSLEQVLKLVESQTGYVFLYDDVNFKKQKISLSVKDAPIEEVLETCLEGLSVSYKIVEYNILFKRDKNKLKALDTAFQQQSRVKGKVTDESGAPLPGVTITVVGTTRGVITDNDGNYTIDVNPTDKLVFSFIGMESQIVDVGNQKTINVQMKDKSQELEDITVTAFGQQQNKREVIGSFTTVRPAELKVPSSNLTTALAGKVAGIISYQRSGEPGQDNADFFIRGVTTFGYKVDPLILIDGVESTKDDLARLQVDDIASFSIMKDATATALYGARGANGVILIATKEGTEGKTRVSCRFEYSLSAPTRNVEMADPVTYMRLYNEAALTRNPLDPSVYSEEKIEKTAEGANSIIFPAVDWKKMLIKDYTSSRRVNLSLSGGGNIARYYVAGTFNQDNGIFNVDKMNNFNNNIDLKTYSLRTNVNINLTKSTELIFRISGTFTDYNGPIAGGTQMFRNVMRANPVAFPAYYPVDEKHQHVKHIMFGGSQSKNYMNPYAEMVKGYKDASSSTVVAQFELKQDLSALTKGLSFRTMASTSRYSAFDISRYYDPFFYELVGYNVFTNEYYITNYNEATATEYLSHNDAGEKTITSSFYLESMFNYNRTFNDKHTLSGLLVFMLNNHLDASAIDLQQSLPYRNLGLSGRTTYSYDNRYFAEFNFGYNGTERFHESKRFGFFPSAGIAWSISNEKFWEPWQHVVSNLRLRATYGLVGNDAIGSSADRFFYLSNVNMNSSSYSAVFGRDGTYSRNGVVVTRYANNEITWETARKTNLALELGLFNTWDIKAEYFRENRDNILMNRTVPNTMGLAATTRANVGKASGEGTDISVDYKQMWNNDLWLTIMGNFTYAHSKYEVYEEPDYPEAYRSHVGKSINQTYGYIAERLFIDDADAENAPPQNFGGYEVRGGDIKYTDVNRDGKITTADMVPIGNPTVPEITYGFGFSLGYKNIDFSAFFQGLVNESFWIDARATAPFAAYSYGSGDRITGTPTNQLLKAYADDHWAEDNRNIYALWPRLSPTINENNAQTSTWFMRNGSFLRLKQVEMGYTFPKSIQDKFRTSTFRIYVSCTNLFTFTKFKLWDVEMGGNGLDYPIQRVINVGLNVNFN
ncbi:MAG: TonB-dependent receptor [Mangrovibacterium sp.]